jgi:four helix bundle protein
MHNKRKGDDIAQRLRLFAVHVLRLLEELPAGLAGKHVARQLERSATAGGANYEEARGAESRADFVHKISVARKEIRESLYWLSLVEDAGLVQEGDLSSLIAETDELVAILTSCVNTARKRSQSG